MQTPPRLGDTMAASLPLCVPDSSPRGAHDLDRDSARVSPTPLPRPPSRRSSSVPLPRPAGSARAAACSWVPRRPDHRTTAIPDAVVGNRSALLFVRSVRPSAYTWLSWPAQGTVASLRRTRLFVPASRSVLGAHSPPLRTDRVQMPPSGVRSGDAAVAGRGPHLSDTFYELAVPRRPAVPVLLRDHPCAGGHRSRRADLRSGRAF